MDKGRGIACLNTPEWEFFSDLILAILKLVFQMISIFHNLCNY